jgi:hypothetical protein
MISESPESLHVYVHNSMNVMTRAHDTCMFMARASMHAQKPY